MPNAQAPSCCTVGGDERDGLRWGVGWRQAGSEEEEREVHETFLLPSAVSPPVTQRHGDLSPGRRQSEAPGRPSFGSLGGASPSSVAKMPLPS